MLRGFWVVLVHLVMGEWAVGQWIVGVFSFQKIYGLYGLNILPRSFSGKVGVMTDRQTHRVHFDNIDSAHLK